METVKLLTLKLSSAEDIIKARQRARQISSLLGFEHQAQTRITTAVSEIARNAYNYAKNSKVEYALKQLSNQAALLEIQVTDQGPGIQQLATILAGQYAPAIGGKGITGTRAIMDHFNISSNARGTCVVMAMNIPFTSLPITQQKIAKMADELARFKASNASDELQQQNQELLHALDLLNKARDELEERVQQRTAQLSLINQELRQEITERIQIEQSLQAVTQQLHLALQSARMGTWIWNLTSAKVTFDHYLPTLLGLDWNSCSMDLLHLLDFIYPADQDRVKSVFQQASQKATNYEIEFRVIWPDQSLHFLASRSEIYYDQSCQRNQLTGVCWDITERRQAEEWLRKHQQEIAQVTHLSAMGELSSMLAHELNQPLTVITTFTQGCIRRLETQHQQAEKILEMMRVVAQQAERAGQIIHHMKDFVRKGTTSHELVSITMIIQESITMMQYEMRTQDVSILFEPSADLFFVSADKIQLEQVIINLMRNAIEAMQDAATNAPMLQISTAVINNTHIAVNVIDNGPGFPADLVTKLTEPYFTTKSQGMGLGLAISRSIIEAHGGHLMAKAAPKGGAWFQFTLPIVRANHEK